MSDAMLVVAPILVPLGGAALALMLRHRPAAAAACGVLTLLALGVVSLRLFLRAREHPVLSVIGGWPQGIGISVSASLPGVLLVLVTALVALAVAIYGLGDIGPRRRRAGYDPLMLAMIAAVNGAFLTDDLFNLYVWFELALLAALGLLTLDRRRAQIDAAIRYAVFAMLAATFILIGVGLIYGITGTLQVSAAAAALAHRPADFATAVAGALLLGGFALKSGLVPFHLWVPASYHAAPTSALAAFAGLLTKMGFFALLLTFAGVFAVGSGGVGARGLVPLFGGLAAATMLLCAAGALAQTDMRRLLAYHVIAQVGYMMAGLALGTREGIAAAIFYMVHSIIVQANLFLGAGLIRRANGSWDLTHTGSMVRREPLFALLFAIPVLSLAGIPPLSGFWAKLIVIRESLAAGSAWLGLVALIAGLLTILSMASFWSDACWKSSRRPARRIPWPGQVAMALLSAATVAIGIAPHWLWDIARQSAIALGGAS